MKNTFLKAAGIVALMACANAAQAGVMATDGTYGKFGASSGERFLKVDTHGAITDLNILVSFSKCNDPAVGTGGGPCKAAGNPYENEIFLRLTSPTGITVDLVNAGTFTRGGNGIGQVDVTFDDEGAALGDRLAPGTFRPVGDLGAFDGSDIFGTWTLLIGDTSSGDPLEYFHSKLIASIDEPDGSVPEPASLGLLAAGMAGLIGTRRRRR